MRAVEVDGIDGVNQQRAVSIPATCQRPTTADAHGLALSKQRLPFLPPSSHSACLMNVMDGD